MWYVLSMIGVTLVGLAIYAVRAVDVPAFFDADDMGET